ncbi:FUSC family protein, partial [Paraburkholderia sp. BR14261]
YDRGLMVFSCLVPVSAILVACWLWVSSGWHDGAGAVTLAAVACCFFAASDEPAPLVFRFFLATAASVVFAGLYLFVALPKVHDFAMLVLLFAGPFILIGTLIPRPAFNMVTMLVAVNTATFISVQSAYESDFFVFLNSNIAGVAGLLFAYLWTRVTRPFGAELAARRLLRSSWSDVALSASPTPIADQRNLTSRMVDRLMQLIPRLAASDEHRHPSIESFRDLRIALNSLDLRRSRHKLDGDVPDAIDRVLAGVSDHYARCARASERQDAPSALLSSIDDAMRRVAARARAQLPPATLADADAQPAPRALVSQRWLRDTLHALVGLRIALYPALAAQSPSNPEAAA